MTDFETIPLNAMGGFAVDSFNPWMRERVVSPHLRVNVNGPDGKEYIAEDWIYPAVWQHTYFELSNAPPKWYKRKW